MSADNRFDYEQWVVNRMRTPQKCKVGGCSCIPLRDDAICLKCFKDDKEAHEKNVNKHDA